MKIDTEELLKNAKPCPSTSGYLWFREQVWEEEGGMPAEIFDLIPDRHFCTEAAAMEALKAACDRYNEELT